MLYEVITLQLLNAWFLSITVKSSFLISSFLIMFEAKYNSGNLMERKAELRRDLSLLEITLVGIGNILGAGIYVLMGKAAGLAGNMVWASFLFAIPPAGCPGPATTTQGTV